jgi:tRNA (guanine37-N1)-methyltransferase
MRFEILTLFPDMLKHAASVSILGRAAKKGLIDINFTNIRDYSTDKHRRTDDAPYGGGYGLVMMCQPAVDCIRDVKSKLTGSTRVIYMSPQGKLFTQEKAVELSKYDNLVFLCGHYEGIDERIIELAVDEEISIGNYVLTGGELPALIVTDAVSRLVPGVLPAEECFEDESIACGLLEFPHYTRPREYEGLTVPEVLLHGNEGEINKWRDRQRLMRTLEKRPDLLDLT